MRAICLSLWPLAISRNTSSCRGVSCAVALRGLASAVEPGRNARSSARRIVDGKRARKTVYGASKREVADAMGDPSLRFQGSDGNASLGEYLHSCLENGRDTRKWATNTYRLRESIFRNHLIPFLGARRLKDIDVREVKLLLQRWAEAGTASSIRAKAFKTLSGACNAAYREEIIYRNPCVLIDAPKHGRKKMNLLSMEQALRLMSETEPVWRRQS